MNDACIYFLIEVLMNVESKHCVALPNSWYGARSETLNPAFVIKATTFVEEVHSSSKPKKLKGKEINGKGNIKLCKLFC